MQATFSYFRLNTKLLAGFAVLLCFMFLAFIPIRDQLVDMHGEISAMVNEYRPVEIKTAEMDACLYEIVSSLGLYASTGETIYAEEFRIKLAESYRLIDNLHDDGVIKQKLLLSAKLSQIRQHIDELSVLGEELLRLGADDESTYPGLAFANKNINPINREILQLLSQRIYAEDVANDLQLRMMELRYFWINVVSGVRGFLAFRSDRILHDTAIYIDGARNILRDIISRSETFDIDVLADIQQIEDAFERFEFNWESLQDIHTSDGWRTDSYLMRTQITPLFDVIEGHFQAFMNIQSEANNHVARQLQLHSQRIGEVVRIFMVIGVLVGVVLAWGISRVVARPIHEIASAMKQIARGEADLTQQLHVSGNDEVAILANSFNTFVDKARQSAEEERALSKLMQLSLASDNLYVYLDKALELLIGTVTWIGLLPKGGIFITSSGNQCELKLTATHNFSPELLDLCATVPFGHCLCGRAAAGGKIVHASCVDHRHDIHFDGIQPHGHYSVPVMSEEKVLGVLILYLPVGHERSGSEELYLNRVASVLSMGISLRQANENLIAAKKRAEVISNQLTGITENIPGIIYQCCRSAQGECVYTYVSPGTSRLLGTDSDDSVRDIKRMFSDIHHQDKERFEQVMSDSIERMQPVNAEYRVIQQGGGTRWILCNALPHHHTDGSILWDGLLLDITEQKTLENQLLQAQKLESVGQLAAGIAHEINTPTQYVQDNTRFLQDAFGDYQSALEALRRLREKLPDDLAASVDLAEADSAVEQADIDYLAEEIPNAIGQSLEGLQRISSIVSAMKEFSHPGTYAMQPVDINAVVENIVTVSRNEWKYVAEVKTDLDESLPFVPGYRDKLGQVVLNMIVNAAHAIGDEVNAGKFEKGTIHVSTAKLEEAVEVRISDNGAGVPESIRKKIFDPFFTTKDVGKGTGQGLSLARTIVVDQHQGILDLESTPGGGATFVIHLPLDQVNNGAIAA